MQKKLTYIILALSGFVFLSIQYQPKLTEWNETTPLSTVLRELGKPPASHSIGQLDTAMVRRGKEIFTTGITTGPDGKKTKLQSKHYQCTHCHNSVVEDPNLSVSDPEARLEYAIENRLPFLQGTTMYGVVNRTSWYNGDYEKKYGAELISPAQKNLREAIQLCAEYCSKGRSLSEWELEAMLHYFWSIEIKLGDLNFTEADWKKLRAKRENKALHDSLRQWINIFYLQASPATWGDPPKDRKAGYTGTKPGNTDHGLAIYALSCLHCHKRGEVSELELGDDILSYRYLSKRIPKDKKESIYQAIREGTHEMGDEAYMPNFTRERMSNQQIEDLRAFIEMKAGK